MSKYNFNKVALQNTFSQEHLWVAASVAQTMTVKQNEGVAFQCFEQKRFLTVSCKMLKNG